MLWHWRLSPASARATALTGKSPEHPKPQFRNPKLFFVPELSRGLLMQLWSAAPNERISRKDRICCDRCRMFPCAIQTIHCHSQSIAFWPFVNRNSQLHLLDFLISAARLPTTRPSETPRHQQFHSRSFSSSRLGARSQ